VAVRTTGRGRCLKQFSFALSCKSNLKQAIFCGNVLIADAATYFGGYLVISSGLRSLQIGSLDALIQIGMTGSGHSAVNKRKTASRQAGSAGRI
jgi:hypothetical protein